MTHQYRADGYQAALAGITGLQDKVTLQQLSSLIALLQATTANFDAEIRQRIMSRNGTLNRDEMLDVLGAMVLQVTMICSACHIPLNDAMGYSLTAVIRYKAEVQKAVEEAGDAGKIG